MHRSLDEKACAALRENVEWTDPWLVTGLVILGLIILIIISGNLLVILAVSFSSKLRTVTNLFIVSLAVSDLLVGLAVLPFSATWEMYKVWIFGDIWCSVWLALDVWLCTASILNLCAISMDRYIAVSWPIRYPSLMSRRRAKFLIAFIWISSFIICLPPLVGWKERKASESMLYKNKNHTLSRTVNPHCQWTCELNNDVGYVVYSALGSFFIPMFVMLFFYWRIYKAAVRTTKAINRGFKTTKGRGIGKRSDDNRLTLRIHRGRSAGEVTKRGPHNSPLSAETIQSTNTSLGNPSPEKLNRTPKRKTDEKVRISISYPSTEQICPAGSPPGSPPALYAVHYYASSGQESTSSVLHKDKDNHLKVTEEKLPEPRRSRRSSSCDSGSIKVERDMSPSSSTAVLENSGKNKSQRKAGKRNLKFNPRKFRMETKAAKTLGIIVGVFIVCWLPFFTMYLYRAFCDVCINPLVFSILFWLGYCNSAMNPLIYALFSNDFRFAFKKILCQFFCKKGNSICQPRRDSDGSQMRRGRNPNNIPKTKSNSLEEESDPVAEGSDSI